MARFIDDLACPWRFTFLRQHVDLLRDREGRTARQFSLLFRYFEGLTLEQFFSGRGGRRPSGGGNGGDSGNHDHSGDPVGDGGNGHAGGAPWFIELDIRRSRRGDRGFDLIPAGEIGAELCRDDAPPVALLSAPGAGKTTLQLYLAFCCLNPRHPLGRSGYVPCFVSGHEFYADFYEQVRASLGLASFPRERIREYIETVPRILFLFDLNRVPQQYQEAFARLITDTFTGHDLFRANQHRVVVAARSEPRLFSRFAADGYVHWTPEPLPDDEVRAFLDTITGESLDDRDRAHLYELQQEQRALFRNPFHLTLISILLASDPERLGEIGSAGRLFKLVSEAVLEHEFAAWETNLGAPLIYLTGLDRPHPGDLVLQALAYEMTERGVRSLHLRKGFTPAVRRIYERYHERPWWPRVAGTGSAAPRLLGAGQLAELLASHSLFRPQGSHVLWVHDTFQDFYAGKFLAYDHDDGCQRADLFDPTADHDERADAVRLLDRYAGKTKWFDQLHFLIDLLEPQAFERLVDGWCLAGFKRGPRRFTVRSEPRPTPFALRYLVEYFGRLGRHDDIEKLVEPPFIEAKVRERELGPEACIADIRTRLDLALTRHRHDPVMIFTPYCWLAVARAVADEEVAAGAIIRDFLAGTPSAIIRGRIDALTDDQIRFFHHLLAAEVHLRHGELDQASAHLEDAFHRAIPGAALLRVRNPALVDDMREYWAYLYAEHELPPQYLIQFLVATRPGDEFCIALLARIFERAGHARAFTLYPHVVTHADRPRRFKPVLKAIVARYAAAGLYRNAREVARAGEDVQREELVGVIIEGARRNGQVEQARELLSEIKDKRLRDHLDQVIDGTRLPRQPFAFEAPKAHSRTPTRGPAAVQPFFVRCRTEILRRFHDPLARDRPIGSSLRRLSPIFDATDRVAARARFGALLGEMQLAEDAERFVERARKELAQITAPAQRIEPAFELFRTLHRMGRESDAGRVFDGLLQSVRRIGREGDSPPRDHPSGRTSSSRSTRKGRRPNPAAEALAEQCAYWGFIKQAEIATSLAGEATWMTRGRHYAHFIRHRLGHHDPDSAFTWFQTECPRFHRSADRRWETWEAVVEGLAEAWALVGDGDLTGALREIDGVRVGILAHTGAYDRTRKAQVVYFQGQMLAHVALLLGHHDALRPLAYEEIARIPSPPMRAYCACRFIRHPRALPPNRLSAADAEALDATARAGIQALAQFDATFIRHKCRVVRDWAEAIALQPPDRQEAWLPLFLDEVAGDAQLMRTALPDLAWTLTRHDRETSPGVLAETLERIIKCMAEANELFGRH